MRRQRGFISIAKQLTGVVAAIAGAVVSVVAAGDNLALALVLCGMIVFMVMGWSQMSAAIHACEQREADQKNIIHRLAHVVTTVLLAWSKADRREYKGVSQYVQQNMPEVDPIEFIQCELEARELTKPPTPPDEVEERRNNEPDDYQF